MVYRQAADGIDGKCKNSIDLGIIPTFILITITVQYGMIFLNNLENSPQ